jgi:putative oxidoreductase
MMNTSKKRQSAREVAALVLRVTAGVIMFAHGYLKLTGFDAWKEQVVSLGIPLPDIAAPLAVAGELLGGAGLVMGLLTPLAAFGVGSTLLVAILSVHLPHGLFAKDGGFEFPLIMLMVAIFFAVRGGGIFSLDHVFFGRDHGEAGEGVRTHERLTEAQSSA